MNRHIIFVLCILFIVGIFSGCNNVSKNNSTEEGISFNATVLENDQSFLLVEPEADSSELSSADKISVSLGKTTLVNADGDEIRVDDIKEGDRVQIFYDGQIAESYPAQIHNCSKIVLMK
ncbi:MAG: DUF3221 domain-containing protein [Clostridiales bacterium]|jgi:hypothetical protein|nr:DUF3221 domain-containing protein [Clostridiales bacterium]